MGSCLSCIGLGRSSDSPSPSPNGERSPLLYSQDPTSYLASALNYGTPSRPETHSQLAGQEDLEPSPPTHIQDIEEVRKERQALEKICTKASSKLIDVSPHVPLPQQTAGSRQLQSSTNDARPSVSSDGPGYSYDPADLQHSPPDSPSATFASLKAKASASAPPIQPLPPQYDFLRLFRETFPPQPSKGHSLAEPAQDQGLLNGAHDKDGSDSDNSQSSNSTLRQKERDWLQSIIERDGQSRRWDPDLVRGTSNTAADEHDGEKKLLFWF